MQGLLPRAARAASRATGAAPRRGLAAHADEPVVPFSDYRAGKVTLCVATAAPAAAAAAAPGRPI
jgi:hypothetical protein